MRYTKSSTVAAAVSICKMSIASSYTFSHALTKAVSKPSVTMPKANIAGSQMVKSMSVAPTVLK